MKSNDFDYPTSFLLFIHYLDMHFCISIIESKGFALSFLNIISFRITFLVLCYLA